MAKEERRISPAVAIIPIGLGLALVAALAALAFAAPPKVYTCPYCGAEFATQEELDAHIELEHPEEPPVFVCPYCGATFTTQAELDAHIEAEHPEIPPEAWVSPTGHIDPNDKWANAERAYDDDTRTFASTWGLHYYGEPLELTLDSPIYCDKIRVYAASFRTHAYRDPNLKIDLHYDGAWHNIWSGVIAKQTWVEIPIPAGTKMVDSARIKWNEDKPIYLYEFNFWSEG